MFKLKFYVLPIHLQQAANFVRAISYIFTTYEINKLSTVALKCMTAALKDFE